VGLFDNTPESTRGTTNHATEALTIRGIHGILTLQRAQTRKTATINICKCLLAQLTAVGTQTGWLVE